MKFLKQLLNTKAPSSSVLLDIAIVFSLVPHLFTMEFLMLVYLGIALYFILKKHRRKSDHFVLSIVGLLLIGLSFFNAYNFSDFSKMQFFVSLMSAVLIYAISLQKLRAEINIYLRLSPMFLMVLSFFFFNSLLMLLYSLLTLYVFVLLYLWQKMQTPLLQVMRYTAGMFILSTPFVALLFLVFPRISIEKAEFGFRGESYLESAYDGEMHLSDKEVRLSNRVSMEVLFENEQIQDSQLYFRGSTLYRLDGLEWRESAVPLKQEHLTNAKNIIKYELSIHPHAENWVYALDMPTKAAQNTKLNADYTLRADKKIYKTKKYHLQSALSYRLSSKNLTEALEVNTNTSQRLYKEISYIKEENKSAKKRAHALMEYFKKQELYYSLKPEGLDLKDFSDSFVLDAKNGYCVHFASAFVKAARMLEVPARVVTGFKASKKNMINNYLIVRASDAHAWVELYFSEEGWVRFDPTTTALLQTQGTSNQEMQTEQRGTLEKLNDYFMYSRYVINNWLLYYDRVKQMALLEKLMSDTLYLVKFVLAFVFLIFLSALAFMGLRNSSFKDPLDLQTKKLYGLLKRHFHKKEPHQSMQVYLRGIEKQSGVSLENISKIYHDIKYNKGTKHTLKEFEQEMKLLQKELKK